MGIKVALEHRTSYAFDRLVQVHPHEIRLRPAPHTRTPIEAYSLRIAPDDHFINWQQDAFGNFLARVVFPNRTRQLSITVGLIADLKSVNPFDFFIEEWAEHIGFVYPPALAADLEPYLKPVDESEPGSGPGELVLGLGGQLHDGAHHTHHRLPRHAQSGALLGRRIRGAVGARRAESRHHAGRGHWFVP